MYAYIGGRKTEKEENLTQNKEKTVRKESTLVQPVEGDTCICLCIYLYIHLFVCIYIYIYFCMCVYVYIYKK
jgi:hypothetical protein